MGTKRLTGLQLVAVAGFTAVGIVLVLLPGLSSVVAQYLHVGRGTDLLLYLALLAGMFVVSNFYFRFKTNEEALIAITRKIALDHPEAPNATSRGPADQNAP